MKLTGIREQVFLDRYSLKDDDGKPMEAIPEEMWRRVAKGISQVEDPKVRKDWEKKFTQLLIFSFRRKNLLHRLMIDTQS